MVLFSGGRPGGNMRKLAKEVLIAGLLILAVDGIVWVITGGSLWNAVATLFGGLLLLVALAIRIICWILEA